MADNNFVAGTVTVETTPTLVCAVGSQSNALQLLVQNTGAATVFLGGPDVSVSTGFPVAAAAVITVPSSQPAYAPRDLYAVTESGTSTVAYLGAG